MNAIDETVSSAQPYSENPLPWAIVDTKRRQILARFEQKSFAQVSLDAIANRLGAYRDCLEVKNTPVPRE